MTAHLDLAKKHLDSQTVNKTILWSDKINLASVLSFLYRKQGNTYQ